MKVRHITLRLAIITDHFGIGFFKVSSASLTSKKMKGVFKFQK
jgi:hypothetical protein